MFCSWTKLLFFSSCQCGPNGGCEMDCEANSDVGIYANCTN